MAKPKVDPDDETVTVTVTLPLKMVGALNEYKVRKGLASRSAAFREIFTRAGLTGR